MVVPAGAPDCVRKPEKPLPSQRTTSSTLHARSSRSRSAWQVAGQKVALACRQLYGVVMTPSATTTLDAAALWLYCTTWSNPSPQ